MLEMLFQILSLTGGGRSPQAVTIGHIRRLLTDAYRKLWDTVRAAAITEVTVRRWGANAMWIPRTVG